MNQDLKIIKKKYGEKMAHLCRDYFPTILETEGLLINLMLEHFEPNHDLCEDIIEQKEEINFKNYIYSLVDVENNKETKSIKSPKELLADVGYDLYECKSEEDIQRFKKYYAKGEELCTFNGGRLGRCHVFFAVKKNVSDIKREDYPNPQRQDEYGTSVISIQFTRDYTHTLSIKNRYNHHVNNPDSTFSNNLDNIVDGLTESFAKHYGLIQQHKTNGFELRGYVNASDGKYYKYNQEHYNIYYCPNNIVIDHFEANRYDKEKYLIFEYFILDLVKKEVRLYGPHMRDSFPSTIPNIKKIEIKRKEETKEIKFILQNKNEVIIVLDKNNRILKLENLNLKEVGDDFLTFASSLQELNTPNIEKVGDCFLTYNSLKKLNLPKLKRVGSEFLGCNSELKEIDLPSLEEVGINFLYYNSQIHKLNLPVLRKAGHNFLYRNWALEELALPELLEVDDNFFHDNITFQEIKLPKLQKAGRNFLASDVGLEKIFLPSLKVVGHYFLGDNDSLVELDLPSLEEVGNKFLYHNQKLKKLDLPHLKKVGHEFLNCNEIIQEVNLPLLESVADYFLFYNRDLKELRLPSLKEVGNNFLFHNYLLRKLDLLALQKVGNDFLPNNIALIVANLPSLVIIGDNFLNDHNIFKEDFIPKTKW